jgi:hypothetical protein
MRKDEQTDGLTDMSKLIVALSNFEKKRIKKEKLSACKFPKYFE